MELAAEAVDGEGTTVSNPGLSWTSSDSSVATVNSSGRVTAHAVGTVLISVAAACCGSDQVTLEVDQRVASVEVSPTDLVLEEGTTHQLNARAVDANGNTVEGASIAWESQDESVVSVTSTGRVSGLAEGTAEVVARVAGHFNSSQVRVSGGGNGDSQNPRAPYPNEPPGLSQIAVNDWSSMPGSWGSGQWGHWVSPNNTNGDLSIVDDPTAPRPGRVLRGRMFEGTPSGHAGGNAGFRFDQNNRPTELYVSTWYKFDEDYIGHPVHVKMDFIRVDTPAISHVHIDMRDEAWHMRFRTEWEPSSMNTLIRQNIQGQSEMRFPKGEWVHIERHFRFQDPGQRNGIVRMWQDGVLIMELSDVGFPGTAFTQFYHEGVYGGAGFDVPQDQSWYVAETYISGR